MIQVKLLPSGSGVFLKHRKPEKTSPTAKPAQGPHLGSFRTSSGKLDNLPAEQRFSHRDMTSFFALAMQTTKQKNNSLNL